MRFIYNCTIESIDRMKKEEGSGAIVAHCMGLGKTLSVSIMADLQICDQLPFLFMQNKILIAICKAYACISLIVHHNSWKTTFENVVSRPSQIRSTLKRNVAPTEANY